MKERFRVERPTVGTLVLPDICYPLLAHVSEENREAQRGCEITIVWELEIVGANRKDSGDGVFHNPVFPLRVLGEESIPAIACNDSAGDESGIVKEASISSIKCRQPEKGVLVARMPDSNLVARIGRYVQGSIVRGW